MRSSTVSTSIADTSVVKISLPWVILALLVWMFSFCLSLMAAEMLPITFLINFVKVEDPEEAKAEARLMIRYTCSAILMFTHLLYGFICFHNPFKPAGVLQLSTVVLGFASRALLAKIPEGVDADSHEVYSYGKMYIVDSTWLFMVYFVIYKRCKTIKSNFKPDQAKQVSPSFTCVCPFFTHMLVVWMPLLTHM